jgi:hypothetical protein
LRKDSQILEDVLKIIEFFVAIKGCKSHHQMNLYNTKMPHKGPSVIHDRVPSDTACTDIISLVGN